MGRMMSTAGSSRSICVPAAAYSLPMPRALNQVAHLMLPTNSRASASKRPNAAKLRLNTLTTGMPCTMNPSIFSTSSLSTFLISPWRTWLK